MTQPSTPDTATEGAPQDFLAFLSGINKGRTVRELGEHLQTLVAAIDETGKGGTLTYKLTIKPAGTSDGVTVTDEITVKAPTMDRPASIFFPDENHRLVRSNPNQSELF